MSSAREERSFRSEACRLYNITQQRQAELLVDGYAVEMLGINRSTCFEPVSKGPVSVVQDNK